MKPISIIGCICWLMASWAQGQEILDLTQCRALALQYNKVLASSVQQTEAARFTMKSYRGNFFPNFSLGGMAVYSTLDGTVGKGDIPISLSSSSGQVIQLPFAIPFPGIDYSLGWIYTGNLQFEQPLYLGGKIQAAYQMSKLGVEMARQNEQLTTTEVLLETDRAYAMMVKAQEMKKVAHRYNELLTELMKNVESARKHGLKSQNDVLKVQVKLNESELNIRKAENGLRLATMNLCHLIGKPLDSQLFITGDYPQVSLPNLQTDDVSARPEYAILDKQVAMARQQVKLNRSEMLPQVGVKGMYGYMHGLDVMNQPMFDNTSFSVLLNVSIPLYHFGERRNKVRAAKVKLQQAQLQQADLQEKMLLELTQAANNLDEARLECDLADRSLEQAEENMRVSKRQYEVGLETLSDHLEAQTLWQQAYETQVDAHFQLYIQYVAYLKASGGLRE
ncbi:MAG: TolC family protein [Parabacteroides sp.]